MGGQVVGAGGAMIGGIMASNAISKAAGQQAAALQNMLSDTAAALDPTKINSMARSADETQALNRLALQAKIDPALAQQRGMSEAMLTQQLGQIGQSASDKTAALAEQAAVSGDPQLAAQANALNQAGMANLAAGANLTPDVQAALMQAGLQQGGQVGVAGGAARGASGTILQQVLGMGAINLQAQREQQAQGLLSSASQIEQARTNILAGLFPRLQQQQMANMQATSGILQQSNNMLPQAGLSGSQVASLWLQRVGALNQIAGNIASVRAQGTLGSGLAMAGAIGTAAGLGMGASQSLTSAMPQYDKAPQTGTPGGGGSYFDLGGGSGAAFGGGTGDDSFMGAGM